MSLRQLLRDANYDEALTFVLESGARIVTNAPDPTERLRQVCMLCDVYDYGGFYPEARQRIQDAGKQAWDRLTRVKTVADIVDATYLKQECWALMEWGMSLYRDASEGYSEVLRRFTLAQTVLGLLEQSNVPCVGSMARSWYCIGLVHRQKKDYRQARFAFGSCIELTGRGIEQRRKAKHSTAAYDYNLARCYGLGIGWIAYDEALLSEAKSALVVANRLLLDKNARFIRAYVDVIHAAAVMSGSIASGEC